MAKALHQVLDCGSLPRGTWTRVHPHQQQSRDDGHVADRVQEEAPALADAGDQRARDRRSHDAGTVEHRRVEGDGVHQITTAHHVGDERLARRDVERVDHANEPGDREDVPHLHAPGECEAGQHEGEEHRGRLRGQQNRVPPARVRDGPAKRREQEDGDLAGKPDESQEHGGPGEAVHQPGLCDGLHPRTGQRDQLAAEEQLVIAMAQRAERLRAARGRHLVVTDQERSPTEGCGPPAGVREVAAGRGARRCADESAWR
jgi:hypothetical protein